MLRAFVNRAKAGEKFEIEQQGHSLPSFILQLVCSSPCEYFALQRWAPVPQMDRGAVS